MYPTLLIGSAAIPTYPLFLLVALWVGMWLSARRAGRLGIDGDHVYNAGLYGLIAGLIGARLWFVLAHWENYADNLGQVFSLSRSALSTTEGVLVAGLVGLIYLQRQRVPLGRFFDAASPGIAAALIIGHVGAFLGGVSLGRPTDLPWAVNVAAAARHPVNLYHAAAVGVILALLWWRRGWRPWDGVHFWLLVSLYSLTRLLLAGLYARPAVLPGGFLAGQVAAWGVLVVSLAIMAYNFSNYDKSSDGSPAPPVRNPGHTP